MILYINNKVDVNYRSLINSSQWNESHSVVLTLCDPMDYTVHGILQARILEWVAFPFSRGSSQPRDKTQVSHIAGGFFTSWAPRCVIIKVLLVSQLASPALWEESLNVTAESILCPSPWPCGVAPGRSSFTTSKYLSLWLSVSSPYMMPFFFFLSVKILTHATHLSWWSGTQTSQETSEWPFSLWSVLRSCSLSLGILYLLIVPICTSVL